ncbi:MAG: hypothetical protein WEA10_10170 [Actinomycetota bacterium]
MSNSPAHDPAQPAGLPREPRPSGVLAAAVGLGGFWGLVSYTILWEGQPVQVNRPFVESIAGTLLLLPARIVIWGVLLAEEIAGRTFDLSSNNLWIGLVASMLSAAIGLGVLLLGRGATRRTIRSRGT